MISPGNCLAYLLSLMNFIEKQFIYKAKSVPTLNRKCKPVKYLILHENL